jgi:hypothetical protein
MIRAAQVEQLSTPVCTHGTQLSFTAQNNIRPARGRILGRNLDKNLTSFAPCYSQSPLQTDFTPHPPRAKVVETGL